MARCWSVSIGVVSREIGGHGGPLGLRAGCGNSLHPGIEGQPLELQSFRLIPTPFAERLKRSPWVVDSNLMTTPCSFRRTAAGNRQSGRDGRIVAVEVAQVLQVVDDATCADVRRADIDNRESGELEGVLLALVGHIAATPDEADTGGHAATLDFDGRIGLAGGWGRRVIGEGGAGKQCTSKERDG